MKPPENLTLGAQIAVMALVVLGLIGGSLIIAHSGFETSPKTRGTQSVFVPLPQAYLMVAAMYGQSLIGLLVLLRARRISKIGSLLAMLGYAAAAFLLISLMR
jgi:hypothetical protein